LFSVAVAIPVTNNSGDPNIPVSFAIPGVGSFTNVLLRLGGNPELGPEEGKTWTAGFDFSPGFLSGLRLSGTYYNIRYDSQIVGPYQAQYLNSAANRAIYASLITPIAPSATCVPGNAATAPAAIRDALENPGIANLPALTGLTGRSFLYGIENLATANLCDVRAILDGRVINAAKTTQDGVDLQASYSFNAVQSFWNLGFSVSKILSNDQQIISTSPELNALDRINFPVSLRARTHASWNRGSWSATVFGNYVGSYVNDTPIQGRANTDVPAWTTFDLNVGYRIPEHTGGPVLENVRFGVTVQNLLDRDVPIVLTGQTANDARNHNPLGRSWQLGFTKQF
jgi:iron complex outermembrane receptor protein